MKSNEQFYIDYLAHMLDESFPVEESYWAIWQNENKNCVPKSPKFARQLVTEFDMYMNSFSDLDKRLERVVQTYLNRKSNDTIKNALNSGFKSEELTNHSYFWHVIPAQTYKAIISRNRAKHQGKISHQVSEKTIKDCLDRICYGAAMIQTTDYLLNYVDGCKIRFCEMAKNTKTYRKILKLCGDEQSSCVLLLYLWRACTSVVDDNETSDRFCAIGDDDLAEYNDIDELMSKCDAVAREGGGEWFTNSSDSGVGEDIQERLERTDCLIYTRPDEAIPLISKLIDKIHIRGDLAGAFVEGGSATCSYVSSMKPDEIYETYQLET